MLRVLTLNEHEEWNQIVSSFSKHDTYWLSGYSRPFMLHGDGEPLLFYYDGGQTRGINVVMKRDIAVDTRFTGILNRGELFDFSTPYGYGGWLIETEAESTTDDLFKEYEEWCRQNHVVSEFVRFHPIVGNHVRCETEYEVCPLGEVIAMDTSSEETIWENIISKNRNMIRKAQKSGIVIAEDHSINALMCFKEIYDETMLRDNANAYYFFGNGFYGELHKSLNANCKLFNAVLDGEVIASSIILCCNGMMNYHLSGSRTAYRHLAPTNLLLYEVAKWGSSNGYKSLYLGGGVGSSEDSLFKFKKAFYRGDNYRFYIGKKTFDSEKYEYLCSMRTEIENRRFFPEYRG